jgi:hypothetical protein
MRTQRCRWRECRRESLPPKLNYYFCSWDCHQVHYAEAGHDDRGYQRSRHESYDRGFWDGVRARPPEPEIPRGIWCGMLLLCHPDKYEQELGPEFENGTHI